MPEYLYNNIIMPYKQDTENITIQIFRKIIQKAICQHELFPVKRKCVHALQTVPMKPILTWRIIMLFRQWAILISKHFKKYRTKVRFCSVLLSAYML